MGRRPSLGEQPGCLRTRAETASGPVVVVMVGGSLAMLGSQFPGRSGRQRQMGGSEPMVRKSVAGENTRELRGQPVDWSTEGRRVIWKGGARHVGVGEVGQRMREAVRNWGGAPHPGQAQSDALPSSTLLLLTTVLGGRYYHQSADEEMVREAYHGLGGKMAGERCPGSGCSSRL